MNDDDNASQPACSSQQDARAKADISGRDIQRIKPTSFGEGRELGQRLGAPPGPRGREPRMHCVAEDSLRTA